MLTLDLQEVPDHISVPVGKKRQLKWTFVCLIVSAFVSIIIFSYINYDVNLLLHYVRVVAQWHAPPIGPPDLFGPLNVSDLCRPLHVSNQTITPLEGTPHLLVSAYMDPRVEGGAVRIISVFKRDSIQGLFCVFHCGCDLLETSPAKVLTHSDHFNFPFVTTDVLCPVSGHCRPSHISLSPHNDAHVLNQTTYLPIRNMEAPGKEEGYQFNFTVCISNLFGDYNNVLQYAQTLEMYRILGVGRVVIYNTSCGPDLNRLLQMYSQEGFVETIDWPIGRHLQPSPGWQHSEHGGDLHYYGQLTTLNDCIYRNMYRSRYVLLNDIDEIMVPYQHASLMPAMDLLQSQHPRAGVFLVQNHIFPKTQFDPSGRFHLAKWAKVPGINILEHIYREEPDWTQYHPSKIIVQPRAVQQTSVHSVLQSFGDTVKVPPELCRLIHVRVPLRGGLKREELHRDTRLWDFHRELIPNVDKALRRAALLE